MAAVPDYCTGWFEGSWASCCAAHDLAYADPAIGRLSADWALAQCVAATSGGPVMAAIMFGGVALFGWFFRWLGQRRRRTKT
ncbi:MAG: hypothetical protein KAG89_20295 [Fulvimarina manganoxydans]|uniref:hypothetical protein n=1 Tax=Fulvimarina manganoxydans TaxID=937218 RepID=UPI002352B515|nr:hypothetical protein [Fulvimarina manganoxydans]MCK5934500.1 hypothetical protein [Fulvimarina manganoxydans]